MKKIVVWGYWVRNFGDDLFLKSLVNIIKDRKEEILIYICCKKEYEEYYKEMGVKVFVEDSLLNKITTKILRIFGKPDPYFIKCKKNDFFVMLGGSLFAENKNSNTEKQQLLNLNCAVKRTYNSFIIGSNFGTYKSEEFLRSYTKLFSKVKDISFRDKNSYDLFASKLNNIRYCLDIALEGKWEEKNNDENIESKNIAISMIDLETRSELKKFQNDYEKIFITICQHHIDNNEKIFLLSFCKKEGDNNVYDRIIKKISKPEMVKIVEYTDIYSICNIIKNCQKIYATRFHAIMMGLYYNKNIVPFIYNSKSLNALKTYTNDEFYSVDLMSIENYCVQDIIKCEQIIRLETIDDSQFSELLKSL